jgi:antibiotic biosynthesis monooxygenase (ABM) superfamily enzyme
MPVWKVLLVVLMGAICLALGLGTVVVPFSMTVGTDRWIWFGGLLAGTLVMGTLFTLFLVHEDRKFTVSGH